MLSVLFRFGIEPRAILLVGASWTAREMVAAAGGGLKLYRWRDIYLHFSVITLRILLIEPGQPIVAGIPLVAPPAEHMNEGSPHLGIDGIKCPCPACEEGRKKKGGEEKETPTVTP